MDNKNIGGIKAIELCSVLVGHTPVIRYNWRMKKWSIRAFGKNFKDKSFNVVVADACDFMIKINESK